MPQMQPNVLTPTTLTKPLNAIMKDAKVYIYFPPGWTWEQVTPWFNEHPEMYQLLMRFI